MRDKKTISLLLCFSLILGLCFSPGNARVSRADEERIDLDSELTRIEVTPDTFVYDGTEKYPEVTVYYDGTKLTYDED
ncbi:MAG: hypothetical protein K5639_05790, partial [Eubacterium sp.]|nr:hypothetical protein [Eubacterium sp.]